MATLLYQGHASVRITSDGGVVLYIDPFAGEGYDKSADIILVTHQHRDHNCINLPSHKGDCVIIQQTEAIRNAVYQSFIIKGFTITAFPASNKNHKRDECVGFIVEADGIKLYHAGDTSTIPEMSSLKFLSLDYALLPVDGKYNMDAREAADCARIIGAKVSIPIHTNGEVLFDESRTAGFEVAGSRILRPGEEIKL
jgi:L-ascorbate metabolism protein UlaG (beta-lactamase superfamily)